MVAVQIADFDGRGTVRNWAAMIRPFTARVDGNIVARAIAIIDSHYQHHWNEPLGHIVMFEAMPNTRDAVNPIDGRGMRWLKANGATAARAGYGLLEFPVVIDDTKPCRPTSRAQNPRTIITAERCRLRDRARMGLTIRSR